MKDAHNPYAEAANAFEDFDESRLLARLAEAGFTRAVVPAPASVEQLCAVREALAYHSSHADAVLATVGMGTFALSKAGTPALQDEFIKPVYAGEQACGFALTEPEAGSDVAGMRLFAHADGDAYVLRGKKTFVSNATIAAWFTVFAQSDQGPLALVVKKNDPGVRVLDDVPMTVAHPMGSIDFVDARVPAARLIGTPGQGIHLALATLDTFRVSVAAAACGMAARALDEAIAHAESRQQFGQRLADFQMIQAKLAECATELFAARGLVRRACEELANDSVAAKMHVAMAKLFATEAAQRIVDAAVQIHGGLGVVVGQKVEALYREIRPLRIYDGTSEMQKLSIAEHMLTRVPRPVDG